MTTNVSIRSEERVKILDLIGEGEIEGLVNGLQSVYLDDVPIVDNNGDNNINGVSVEVRTGTPQQTAIPGCEAAVNIDNVGQQVVKGWLKSTNPDEWVPGQDNSPEYVIVEPNTDSIIVTLEFEGLFKSGVSDYNSKNVEFQIEYKKYLGEFEDIPYLSRIPVEYPLVYTTDLIYLSGEDTILNYTNTNYGLELTVIWNRSIKEETEYGIIYNGTYAKAEIYTRISGAGVWPAEPDANVTIVADQNYIGSTAYPVSILKDAPEVYEYKIVFTDTDDPGSTSQPSIRMYPTLEYNIVADTITMKDTALSPFKQDFKFDLNCTPTEFPVTVRVTRLTIPDEQAINENQDDDTGLEQQSSFSWDTISKIVDQKFTYPNSAVMGISFSSQTYDTIPKRTYDMKLLRVKVPTNYDPLSRVYDGFWDGCFKIAWTDNPAWCLYDLMTSERFGIGQYLIDYNATDPCNKFPTIDKWALYEISKFCDELVPTAYGNRGLEPRFTCNTYITQQEEAFILLRNLASIFRGMLYWMDNKLTSVFDHPVETFDIIFSNSNVENGLFTYSGSSKDTRYNTVYVNWSDPSLRYENSIEYVENTEDIALRGIISTDLIALGCTSRGQAYRAGKWLLYTEQETVVFSVSLDNMKTKPGDVVQIYDKFRANVRNSGRVTELRDDSIVLDSELELEDGVSYTLRMLTNESNTVDLPDGSTEETLTPKVQDFLITKDNAKGTLILLNQSYDKSKFPNYTIWAIFEKELQAQLFKIISVVEKEKDKYEINAIKFNNDKLGLIEDNIPMIPPVFRKSDKIVKTIDNIVITEALKISGNTVINTATVDWGISSTININEFIVEYKYEPTVDSNTGVWLYLGRSDSNSILLEPAPEGYYTFRVSSVLYSGSVVPPVYSDVTHILGKSAPPKDVENFSYEITNQGIRLNWDMVDDLDLSYYSIQNGYNTAEWNDGTTQTYNPVTSTFYDILNYTGSQFLIKAVDTTGNESENAASLSLEGIFELPTMTNLTGVFTEIGYTLSWLNTQGIYPISYIEIREDGTSFDDAEYVTRTSSDNYIVSDFTNWNTPEHTYWIRIYDTTGAYTETVFVQELQLVYLTNIRTFVTDNYVYLNWNINEPSFNMKQVEIYRSIDYTGTYEDSSAELIGISTDSNFTYYETNNGSVTYWLVPVDVSGNTGIVSSTTFNVNDDQVLYKWSSLFDSVDYVDVERVTGKYMIGPVETADETWATHFTNNGYTTIADHILDNELYYLIQSSTLCTTIPCTGSTSYYEEIFDLGDGNTAVAGTVISVILDGYSLSHLALPEEAFIDVEVSTSLVGVTYNPQPAKQIITRTADTFMSSTILEAEADFRYIKMTINFYSGTTSEDSLFKITSLDMLVSVLDSMLYI